MYLKILFKYIFGYVYIRIEGFYVERVINKLISKKIFLWNLKRDKSTIAYTNIGIKDFKEIARTAQKHNCRIKILEKKGLPFFLHKYRKRKIFAIAIILVVTMLIALSKFIWNIDVEGIEKLDKDEIIKEIEKDGLKIGTLKSRINTQDIVNKVRLKRQDISWIGIELNGTDAIIKIVEANAKPEIIDENDYCNITATKDAQIIKISAQNGIPLVKEGDIVTKGQILIAGWIDGKYTGTRYVHADGKVEAKVWYKQKEKIELNQTISERTGNIENKYKIKFNNFAINLYKTLSKFKNYDTIETNNKLKIFSNFYLPIEVIKETNYEKAEKKITYGIEEAKELGIEKISKQIETQLVDNSQVLQKYIKSYGNEGYIEVEVTYECLENIMTKEKIVF